jgi:glycosyltransferase involved in cell wall biosynthesis
VNILIINHHAGRPDLGMAFRPYYLAHEWTRLGHSVTITGGTYSHIRKAQPLPGEEEYNGIRYIWIKTRRYEGNGPGRVFSMLQFVSGLWLRARAISFKCKPDVVIASSTYPLDIYPARRIAHLSGAKLCFELHDLWPLSPLELGGYSPSHPFIRIMQKAEDYYCKHADKVISILPLTRGYLEGRGLDARKFYYVPNGIALEDWEDYKPVDMAVKDRIIQLRDKYDLLIAYAGAHGIANALNTLLDAAGRLSGDKVGVVLVGPGPEKDWLKKYALEKKINNVYFFDPIPKNEIPSLLELFDALYIGLRKESLFRFGISPNKIFDYMMASKPIIQAIDAGNNLVQEANCGVYAEAENVDDIVKAVLQLKSFTREERDKLGQNGREYVLKNHTYPVLAKKFLDAISN